MTIIINFTINKLKPKYKYNNTNQRAIEERSRGEVGEERSKVTRRGRAGTTKQV